MSHLHTHIHGNLIDNPDLRVFKDTDSVLCKFRLATSRRRPTEEKDSSGKVLWEDVDQLYIDVECWGQLATNVAASLKRGLPVSVCGKLVTETWLVDAPEGAEQEKLKRSKIVLKATQVAFDLARHQVSSVRSEPVGNTLDGQEPLRAKTTDELTRDSRGDVTDRLMSEEDAIGHAKRAKEREPVLVGAAAGGGGAGGANVADSADSADSADAEGVPF